MRFMAEKRMLSSWASALRASSHLVITPISGPIASWGLMNPGMGEIRFGNNATHKKPAAPWGQQRAFYLFPTDPEQSGDVVVLLHHSCISYALGATCRHFLQRFYERLRGKGFN